MIPSFVFSSSDNNDEIYKINSEERFIGVYFEDENGNQVYDENGKPKTRILFHGKIYKIFSTKDEKPIEKQ
jgi:hypothetical protein